MGSKRRNWKYISPIILEGRTRNQYYVEPFFGSCSSILQVEGKRIAADVNPYLIGMWKELQEGDIKSYFALSLFLEYGKEVNVGGYSIRSVGRTIRPVCE